MDSQEAMQLGRRLVGRGHSLGACAVLRSVEHELRHAGREVPEELIGLREAVSEGFIPESTDDPADLEFSMVQELASRGQLTAALAVLVASGQQYTDEGSVWGTRLATACAPCPPNGDPRLANLQRLIVSNHVWEAIELLGSAAHLPPWASARLRVLQSLVADTSAPMPLAGLLREKFESHNVNLAYDAAREYRDRCPDDPNVEPVLAALKRLITSVTQGDHEFSQSTMAASELATGQFHFTMGNIEEALSCGRLAVTQDRSDPGAQQFVEDLEVVHRILTGQSVVSGRNASVNNAVDDSASEESATEDVQTREANPVWSDDDTGSTAVVDVDAMALGVAFDDDPETVSLPADLSNPLVAPISMDEGEETTAVTAVSPDQRDSDEVLRSLDQEAEARIAAGDYDEALQILTGLMTRFPSSAYYRNRLQELMNLIERESDAGNGAGNSAGNRAGTNRESLEATVHRSVPEELRREAAAATGTPFTPSGSAPAEATPLQTTTHEENDNRRPSIIVQPIVTIDSIPPGEPPV